MNNLRSCSSPSILLLAPGEGEFFPELKEAGFLKEEVGARIVHGLSTQHYGAGGDAIFCQ
eukprot:3399006-Pleurochrysis_carterae.AAC.1